MRYPILPDSDPILHNRVEDFRFGEMDIDPRELARNLVQTMLDENAFGLAANQCGLPYRAFALMNPTPDEPPMVMFNPIVLAESGEQDGPEGCLTFPGLVLKVKRSAVVTIKGQNELGLEKELTLIGLYARGALHEIDHLNGVVFTERVSKLRLERGLKKRSKR